MKFRPVLMAAAVLAVMGAVSGVAHADTVPFTDPNVEGFLAFCDAHDNPITSGSLTDKPFVAKVVASVSSPDAYAPAKGGKATLYAYQPRDGYDPGEWSNGMMTGSSRYSNQKFPMAEGTTLDPTMRDQLVAYPAVWDNLVQLRLIYTAPNMQAHMQPYPASVIRIVGDRWEMVNPQTLPCGEGKAVSFERDLLPASTFSPKPSAAAASSSSPGDASSSAAGTTHASLSAGSSGSTAASGASGSPGSSSSSGQGTLEPTAARTPSNATPIAAVLAVLAAAALAGGAWVRLRKR